MNRKEIVNEMTMLKTKMKVLKKELNEIIADYVKWKQDIKKYNDDINMPIDLMMYYEYPDLYIEWYTYVNGKSPDKIYDKTLKKDIAYTDHKLNKLHTLENIIWPSGG